MTLTLTRYSPSCPPEQQRRIFAMERALLTTMNATTRLTIRRLNGGHAFTSLLDSLRDIEDCGAGVHLLLPGGTASCNRSRGGGGRNRGVRGCGRGGGMASGRGSGRGGGKAAKASRGQRGRGMQRRAEAGKAGRQGERR